MTDAVCHHKPGPKVNRASQGPGVPRVSVRTLVLLVELLVALVALQYVVAVRPARAGVVWLERRGSPAALPAPADILDGRANT